MARKTKLTPDVQSKIINALEAGNYFDASCEYAGISKVSGYAWMNRGKAELERRENPNVKEGSKQWEKEQPFINFLNAVSHASANVEIRTVAMIQQAGKGVSAKYDEKGNELMPAYQGDWRALTWFMEKRYPTKWGKQYSESVNKNIEMTWEEMFKRDDTTSE